MKLKSALVATIPLLLISAGGIYFYTKILEKKPTKESSVQANINQSTPEQEGGAHLFKPLSKRIYTSREERLQLFEELGIEYLDETQVALKEIYDCDPKETEKYKNNPEFFETLHEIYADDIANHLLMPISLRWLGEKIGHGIFAETDFYVGDFIGEYTGVIENRMIIDDKDYSWSYPINLADGTRSILDAKFKGNELRFINDGLNPNCQVQYLIGKDNIWHVIYIASADIKKGQQLLVSYGPAYWQTRNYGYQELADK